MQSQILLDFTSSEEMFPSKIIQNYIVMIVYIFKQRTLCLKRMK